MTKVLVAGDIGQPVYHVGDEAMTVASATFFAGRGARIVLATRDEEHSRQRTCCFRGHRHSGSRP